MQTGKSDYKTELDKNGAIAFVPGGNSMWPIIKNKKQSVIVKSKSDRLNVYDVAFYQRPTGAFVLHRIIEVLEDGYLCSGDSQLETEIVKEDWVFGVMDGFYEGKKYISVQDKRYINKVEKWYKNAKKRERQIKSFYFFEKVKNKIKRIFNNQKKEEKDV